MAKLEDLRKYYWLKKEVERLEEKLLEIDTELQHITMRYTINYTKGGTKDKLGDLITKKVMLEEKINKRLGESYRILAEIEEVIKALEPRERYLIRLRYLENKSWFEISGIMNYSIRHLKRINKKIINEYFND